MALSHNFTSGPIAGPLFRFALPVMGALLLQSLYGAVDLFIVGHFASSADVSAVSTGSQIRAGERREAPLREAASASACCWACSSHSASPSSPPPLRDG